MYRQQTMATPLLSKTSLFHTLPFTSKPFSFYPIPIKSQSHFHLKAAMMEGSEITQEEEVGIVSEKKKIFVAGANGNTGKRIVQQLLAKGFAVKAGVRDVDKAKTSFAEGNPDLQFENRKLQNYTTGLSPDQRPLPPFQWRHHAVTRVTNFSSCSDPMLASASVTRFPSRIEDYVQQSL